MIQAESFIQKAKDKGFVFYSGVPCSYLKPFINFVIDSPDLQYVAANNEGEASACAAGATLGGLNSVTLFQNSGLGNAVSPLTSLHAIFKIPTLIIVTHRGEPGGPADEPQHALMGPITTPLLELMGIPWEVFPQSESEIGPVLERASWHIQSKKTPFALVMKKDSVAPYSLKTKLAQKDFATNPIRNLGTNSGPLEREEVLKAVQELAQPQDIILASTGFTGRALYACSDRANQFYMVGSMGCLPALALGLAQSQPSRKIFAIDGDGSSLMRLGAYSMVGYQRPKNLIHICLDNEVHDSTGGQSTGSHSLDLAASAWSCGYPNVSRVYGLKELAECIQSHSELQYIHIKTARGPSDHLPRPKITPEQVKDRLQAFIQNQ